MDIFICLIDTTLTSFILNTLQSRVYTSKTKKNFFKNLFSMIINYRLLRQKKNSILKVAKIG